MSSELQLTHFLENTHVNFLEMYALHQQKSITTSGQYVICIHVFNLVLTWLVSELSLLLSASSWEAANADSSEADCVVEGVGVYRERDWRLVMSGSSSSSIPWWQRTKSTRSSFSLQVSVGMLRSSKYWRRSFTRRRMSRGRWKAVAFSKWHVAQMRKFSWSTEHREQKLFLQSQQIYWGRKTRWWKWGN